MHKLMTRTAVSAVATLAAGSLLAATGPTLGGGQASAVTAGRTFVAPTSIKPGAVLQVGAFQSGKRHVLLRPGTPAPRAKQVIVSGFGAHTPDGLVARVDSVRRLADGRIDVTTTRAPLNEVLQPGDHHVVRTVSNTPATSRAGTGPKPFSVTASCPGSNLRNIHLDGSFDLTANLDVHLDTTLFGVQNASVTFQYGDDLDLRLLLDGKLSCKASMPIATVKVPFMVGPVPFVASLDLTADGSLTADGQLVLHGTQHLDGTSGFSWTPAEGMQPIGSLNNSAHLDDPSFTGTAGLEVGLTAGVGLSVAEVVKAHLDARGYVHVDANPAWTPWWSTKAGVQVNAGLWVVFVGDIKKWVIYQHEWNLDQALGLPAQNLPLAVTGHGYAANVQAVGGHAPYTFAMANGSALPAGLSMASSGQISGTPGSIVGCQDVPFRVLVTDAQLKTAARDLTIRDCNYVPPVIDSSSFQVADIEVPLDVWLQAHGDNGPFRWSSSSLPAGYSLTTDGHLTTAVVGRAVSFPVTVTDAVGSTATRTIRVTVPVDPPDPGCPPTKPWLCG